LNYKGDKVDPGKVIVTHLAASDHFYKSEDRINNTLVLKKYKIPPVPYVLGLSILDPRKNMIQIIDAYADLVRKEKINDLNLVLVGPAGYDFQKITNAKQKYPDLKNRIIVTGFVADEDLAAVYSEALMFVYPSIYEGFGLPLLEAMKCGVPVITSNNSSMPEVAGDAAILIDPLDRSQLSNAMHELYSDSVLRDRFASLGFERSKLFSWKRCAEETVDAYRKSIA
jgi:glycosyltransferase involved in cell wall biosynthesis